MVVSQHASKIDITVELMVLALADRIHLTPKQLLDALESDHAATHVHSLLVKFVMELPHDILGRLAGAWDFYNAPQRARSLSYLDHASVTDWRVSNGHTIMCNMAVGTVLSVLTFKAVQQKGQDRFS